MTILCNMNECNSERKCKIYARSERIPVLLWGEKFAHINFTFDKS